MLAQIEILASLQNIDREIKQQKGRKQDLLGELETQEQEIRAKKREIDALLAGFTEKEKLRSEKDRVFQDEGKEARLYFVGWPAGCSAYSVCNLSTTGRHR